MNKREEEIRRIAYFIWEQQGRPIGRNAAHWLEAERIWEARQGVLPGGAPPAAADESALSPKTSSPGARAPGSVATPRPAGRKAQRK